MLALRRLLSFGAPPPPPSVAGVGLGRVLRVLEASDDGRVPPPLRAVCARVPWPLSAPASALVADMLATAAASGGGALGLAAPQVGGDLRVVVVRAPRAALAPALAAAGAASPARGFAAVLNPAYAPSPPPAGGAWALGVESCLSEPGRAVLVRRPAAVRATWQCAASGAARAAELRGLAAVVWQHECDHLDGVLASDRAAAAAAAAAPRLPSGRRDAALRRAAAAFRAAYAREYDDGDLL
jgi:peptide deformylase